MSLKHTGQPIVVAFSILLKLVVCRLRRNENIDNKGVKVFSIEVDPILKWIMEEIRMKSFAKSHFFKFPNRKPEKSGDSALLLRLAPKTVSQIYCNSPLSTSLELPQWLM